MDNNDFRLKFKKLKNLFLKFWRSEDSKISLIRDIVVALLLVLIIISALWSYTGQWFGTPMVAIESGSMMHLNEPFGRIGTIDAGDMVLLVTVNSRSDISTEVEKDPDNFHYGMNGDVIVYRPYGDVDRDQIIHRAMCWVDYHEEYDTYTIKEYGLYNVTKINIPNLGLNDWTHPRRDLDGNQITPHSGYFTQGDNPNTNDRVDQAAGGICNEPIKLSWVSGKARGELPWIGTLNLLFNDIVGGKNTLGNVPGDSLTCLVILIIVLISIPISLDLYSYYKERKKQQQ